jgi:hypothetical protein
MKKIFNSLTSLRPLVFGSLIILSILYTLGAGLYYSWGILYKPDPSDADYISTWESRLADLKQELPSTEKTVGYVSNWDMTGYDKDVYIEFVLTQYALAPLFVERNLDHEWIIANSNTPGFLDWLSEKLPSSYTINNFGSGIYLLHREDL